MRALFDLRSFFWASCLRFRGARVGRNFRADAWPAVLLRDGANWTQLTIGDDVTFGDRVFIRVRRSGRIVIENGVTLGTDVWLVAANDSELRVGRNTRIGSYCILNGGHGISIGQGCLLAAFVYLVSSDHGIERNRPIQEQSHVGAPVTIGSDVWLGGHVFVGKGVRIGEGAVIGAGAVVVKDVPEYVVAAGSPAREIRKRT